MNMNLVLAAMACASPLLFVVTAKAADTLKAGDPAPKVSAKDRPNFDPMMVAMMHGGPEPSEVPFLAKILPVSSDTEMVLAKDNKDDGKTKGPYRRYRINFAVRPSDISCSIVQNGIHHCELEFISYVYDESGSVIISLFNGIKLDIPPSRLAEAQRQGLQLHQDVSVPVKGEHHLRVGIHDMISDHVGAMEKPVAQIGVKLASVRRLALKQS